MKKVGILLLLIALASLFFNVFTKESSNKEFTTQTNDVYDLALTKTLSPTSPWPFVPGDAVTFLINVYNQGTVPSGQITVTDYVPNWLLFTNASVASTNMWSNILLTVPNIDPWNSATINIWYTIDATFAWGNISNYAEISQDNGDDVDSTPDQNKDNDCLLDNRKDMFWCSSN